MKSQGPMVGPVRFTDEEIQQARNGNYDALDKRLKRELRVRSRMFQVRRGPAKEADLKRIMRKAGLKT